MPGVGPGFFNGQEKLLPFPCLIIRTFGAPNIQRSKRPAWGTPSSRNKNMALVYQIH